jgi:type I restriction enzyme S subunit
MGQSPLSEDVTRFDEGEGLPFLQGNAEFGTVSPTPKHTCNTPPKTAKVGDLLVSVRAPVGALNIADQMYGIGRGLCAVTWKNVEPRFGWWAMHFHRGKLSEVATGSTYEAVSAGDLGNLFLALPDIETQRLIADYLDREIARIDALVAEKEKMLALLEEKRAALISRAVTRGLDPNAPLKPSGLDWLGDIPAHWEVRTLKKVSARIDTGSTPSASYMDGTLFQDFLWFTPGDFENGCNLTDSKRKIPREAIEDKEVKVFPANSIMVIGIGATLGKVATSPVEFSANQQINVIHPSEEISSEFLLYLLHGYKNVFRANANSATLPILNQERLGAIQIPFPPIEEQLSIVAKLEEKTAIEQAIRKELILSLSLIKERRAALITSAVTGQIPVEEMSP